MNNKNSKNGSNISSSSNCSNKKQSMITGKVILDSITKLDPRYLAKNNAVMFTVEVGFIVVALIIALFPGISVNLYVKVRYSTLKLQ